MSKETIDWDGVKTFLTGWIATFTLLSIMCIFMAIWHYDDARRLLLTSAFSGILAFIGYRTFGRADKASREDGPDE